MEKPNRVFVSHSALDREFVEREIVALLTGQGINVWYSQQDIRTASQWQLSIQEGLDQCDWFLVVMSPRSVVSRWVRAEVHWAMDERPDRVVPVLMEDCDWPRLHLMMRTIQYVDLRGNLNDAKRQLLQTWGVPAETAYNLPDTNAGRLGEIGSAEEKKSSSPQPRAVRSATPDSTPVTPRPEKRPATANASGEIVSNSIDMRLKLIPAGEFMMGADSQHRVRLTKPCYFGVYTVTQEQYEQVMEVRPWQGQSYVKEGPDYPAVYVSWTDAVEFCRKLSEREGVEYCLPTEAQWEYACRAGSETAFSFGGDASKLGEYAWYRANAWESGEQYAHAVGQKLPNPWGLHDMHGNVWEWCWDWYGTYEDAEVTDPRGPASGSGRVLRGGAFSYEAGNCRSAIRLYFDPVLRFFNSGFRVSRTYS